jgi:hypothetical protein
MDGFPKRWSHQALGDRSPNCDAVLRKVMKRSRQVIQVRSYALAFAVALSPALFQAYSCDRGDTYLLTLKLLVDGQDQIQGFNANNRSYAATVYSHSATLTVGTRMPDSRATYQWIVNGTTIEAGEIGVGGGTVLLTVPDGQSKLYIGVRAVEGNVDGYTVDVSTCADGAACPFQGETGLCFDGECRSGQCEGVEFFQRCDAPISGGFEGACIADLCASVAPIDECVRPGMGRINCCSQQGCADGTAMACPGPLHNVPCDPAGLEAPGDPEQTGLCNNGTCVATTGPCAGVVCPTNQDTPCTRNDCNPATGQCEEWPVDGYPYCETTFGTGGYCFGGICAQSGPCDDACPVDNNPCTRDLCDWERFVNGSCDNLECCTYFPEPTGTPCELPNSPGQWGYCSEQGNCELGSVRRELGMACTDDLGAGAEIMPFELEVYTELLSDRIPAGVLNQMGLTGRAYLPEAYLDGMQTRVPGGVDKVDVRELQATVVVRDGAFWTDTALPAEDIAFTCALGDSLACDPANDQAGTPGHQPNTDCSPVGPANPCGRFVSLPTSSDCDPGGVCRLDDWQNIKGNQCAQNGFCVIDRLGLELVLGYVLYQPYRSDRIYLGWDDRNTGATLQSGGPNDGTWNLPPAVYSNAVGPNGLRLGFAHSASGESLDVAIECTMGVDSQGPHGVYSADPLSSPTPTYSSSTTLLTALAIFPTGLFLDTSSGYDVCLYVDPFGNELTADPSCDVAAVNGAHSFEIDVTGSCAFGFGVGGDYSIDPGGNFGNSQIFNNHFQGNVPVGRNPQAGATNAFGTARLNSSGCPIKNWSAKPYPTVLPDGGTCHLSNMPCILGCGPGGCTQTCDGNGVDCNGSCPYGSCTQECENGASCGMTCDGGGCYQRCASGSSCGLYCDGGGCTQDCSGASSCGHTCSGGGCSVY